MRKRLSIIGVLVLLGMVTGMARASQAPSHDVRILIDISGSMKHNDPHNLRAPALRLLTGLLPKEAEAGVWTYGRYVNMLVPHGTVTPRWREQAQAAAAEIHSLGLHTNIEDAIARATAKWQTPDASRQRSVILLTDGLVDISQDPVANAASRKRIVNDLLPRLTQIGASVYSVALSDDADHALLRQLASASGGDYQQVQDAEQLQRVFLRIFEQATQPDTLPLEGNKVQVDSSIQEVTFLIFRATGAEPTQIISPSGERYTERELPPQARWHADTGYDLVTIEHPSPGDWRIVAQMDNDNRVMVVSDLKVRATSVPNSLSPEDAFEYQIQLTQRNQLIRDQAFLDLTQVSLTQSSSTGEDWQWDLFDDGRGADRTAHDGTFTHWVSESLQAGRHELVLHVEGATFKREQRQSFEVYAVPVAASVTPDPVTPGAYALTVVPHGGLLEPDSLRVVALIGNAEGEQRQVRLPQTGPAEWRDIVTGIGADDYQVSFQIEGRKPSGKPVRAQVGPYAMQGGRAVEAPQQVESPPPASADPPLPEKHATPMHEEPAVEMEDVTHDDSAAPPGEEHIDWLSVAWQTAAFNLALGLIGYAAYRKWRKRYQPSTRILEGVASS